MDAKFTVRIPATSANMGPGFDCLGIALDIWNSVQVIEGQAGGSISGQGRNELPTNATNLVDKSFARIFEEMGISKPPVHIRCENRIHLARGLGSSSAALVGGLVAGNEYAGNPFGDDDLLKLATEMEGHPDNVSPALLGGMQSGIYEEDEVVTASVPFPDDLSVILFIPDYCMPTNRARNLLTDKVSRSDAVYNIGRAALLVHAMMTGDLNYLKYATQDKLHQPARESIFYPMKNVIRAAMNSGAVGSFLSGAGSTILALATERLYTIGYEMADAGAKSGIEGEIVITKPSAIGAHVV